jgi:2-oxoglutarate dehydrogenase complex dehydrogenase (E1) component-like enzyme
MNFTLSQEELQNAGNPQYSMISYYRKYGHLAAQLDPLKLMKGAEDFPCAVDFKVEYKEEVSDTCK